MQLRPEGEQKTVAVYKYHVMLLRGEEFEEEGTVVAHNEEDARQKLKVLNYRKVKLKKLGGLSALVRQFTADIR